MKTFCAIYLPFLLPYMKNCWNETLLCNLFSLLTAIYKKLLLKQIVGPQTMNKPNGYEWVWAGAAKSILLTLLQTSLGEALGASSETVLSLASKAYDKLAKNMLLKWSHFERRNVFFVYGCVNSILCVKFVCLYVNSLSKGGKSINEWRNIIILVVFNVLQECIAKLIVWIFYILMELVVLRALRASITCYVMRSMCLERSVA